MGRHITNWNVAWTYIVPAPTTTSVLYPGFTLLLTANWMAWPTHNEGNS